MKIMSLFEKTTKVHLKDCFEDNSDRLVFVVKEHRVGKAVGKKAVHVKKLEKLLNRKIKIVGFTPNLIQFVKNLIYPLKLRGIEEKGKTIVLEGKDTQTKAMLIGKNGQNLKNYTDIVKRYFDIKEIKVI